jgi:hypothetical protein
MLAVNAVLWLVDLFVFGLAVWAVVHFVRKSW